jgi:predicted DNA-binding transcriptional regulator AlpA
MRILSPTDLREQKGIDFCNPYRIELEGKGRFPKRIRLSDRRYGYSENEVEYLVATRSRQAT